MVRDRHSWMGWVAVIALLGACGGEPPGIVEPDPAVMPFVGNWEATEFIVTSTADTTVTADLLLNGSFDLNVQPSGAYTATLVLGALTPFVELGQLSVGSGFVTLTPSTPTDCLGSSEYEFTDPDHFTLDGPTCFDFNLDGEDEDATAHIELARN